MQRSEEITQFELDDVRLFWSMPDAADQCLDEAFALTKIIASAMETERQVQGWQMSHGIDVISDMNATLRARALDGIARLIAMARYCQDAARVEVVVS